MARPPAIERKSVIVHGLAMAYLEAGAGDPIVLLQGNPTSSHLWRNVIPHLAGLARCLAPDLIGMGDSDKLADSGPGRYRLVEHRRFLDGFLDAMTFERPVTLVVHDWAGRWASTGRADTETPSGASHIWRPSSARSRGPTGGPKRGRGSSAYARPRVREWCWRRTYFSKTCCRTP